MSAPAASKELAPIDVYQLPQENPLEVPVTLCDGPDAIVVRYALIYGHDLICDMFDHTLMRMGAFRLIYSRELIKAWLLDPRRRVVRLEQIVFEPSGIAPHGCINTFQGWPLAPKNGDVAPFMELLLHVIGGAAQNPQEAHLNAQFVLRWMALPLQNPGTKIATALVIHGPQGVGKSLLFEPLLKIYGQYGTVIGQMQLESKFTDWVSRKLFALCEEVLSIGEQQHHKNSIKHLVTGDVVQIESKFQPVRTERNLMNMAFLSNEGRPLVLEADDRRYAVFWTPAPRTDGLYVRVRQWLDKGGAAALYAHLLTLDIGDFHAHTKPPMTQAKLDVIELGLRSSERFTRDWLDHQLDLPVWPCSTQQLYRAYSRWARQQGERSIASQSTFTSSVGKYAAKRLERIKCSPPTSGQGEVPITLWQPNGTGPLPGVSRYKFSSECVATFETSLSRFCYQQGDPA